jgi:hypothetical protein
MLKHEIVRRPHPNSHGRRMLPTTGTIFVLILFPGRNVEPSLMKYLKK